MIEAMKPMEVFRELPKFKADLEEYINDEILDVMDVIPAEELAKQVIKIAQRIAIFWIDRPQMPIHGVIGHERTIWNVKVRNYRPGWVSVSSDEKTGVSKTEYLPFYSADDEEGWFAGLKNLASMINEAWYLCEKGNNENEEEDEE